MLNLFLDECCGGSLCRSDELIVEYQCSNANTKASKSKQAGHTEAIQFEAKDKPTANKRIPYHPWRHKITNRRSEWEGDLCNEEGDWGTTVENI